MTLDVLLLVSVVIFFLAILPSHGLSLCPAPEDIYPCTCTSSDNTLTVFCSGFRSVDELDKSILGFKKSNVLISNFVIENSKFEYMPGDLFQNAGPIKQISINRCNLTRIGNLGDDQFKGLENSLESLNILKSFDEKSPLAYVSLGHLKKLRFIDVSDSHVEVLHNEWFKTGPTSLTSVRFHKGEIRVVGYKSLQSLVNLKLVDLSDNKINYIARSAFPEQAEFMTDINLERNKLTSFPEDFFLNMPSLKTINLELNDFTTIDEKLWMPVWPQLQDVNIDFNPLVCDSNIKWIYGLDEDLSNKLTAMCYKPFRLMERELASLEPDELKGVVKETRKKKLIKCFQYLKKR